MQTRLKCQYKGDVFFFVRPVREEIYFLCNMHHIYVNIYLQRVLFSSFQTEIMVYFVVYTLSSNVYVSYQHLGNVSLQISHLSLRFS